MTGTNENPEEDLWDRYLAAYRAYDSARSSLFQLDSAARVELLKSGIKKNGIEPAMEVLTGMNTEEVKSFLEELLTYVGYPKRYVMEARALIKRLPREWLIDNIEENAECALTYGDYTEYGRIGYLYLSLDRDLAYRLAQRALAHPDPDVQEVGRDIMSELNDDEKG